MDQLMYYIYKTDEYMDEHDPNLNNTDILTTEGHQFPKLTKNYKVNQDKLDPWAQDEYYSSDKGVLWGRQ